MRLIDADALLTERKKSKYYHLPNGDIAIPIIDVEHAPTVQPETATVTIGRTKGGVVMWYECDACGESIDQKDCYCRNCGRKLTLPEPYKEGGEQE